jgi:FixJ family two-component response regulator
MTTKTRKYLVAVVDDDPRMLESLQDLMESGGYLSKTFPSAEALLAAELPALDALITDIGLGGMDGLALSDAMRRVRPGLPVFVITGRVNKLDGQRHEGIAGFFRKPFDARALLAAVATALEARENGEGA